MSHVWYVTLASKNLLHLEMCLENSYGIFAWKFWQMHKMSNALNVSTSKQWDFFQIIKKMNFPTFPWMQQMTHVVRYVTNAFQ